MQKYKPFIISSLLAAIIITTPVISFAENNDKNGNDNQTKSFLGRIFNSSDRKTITNTINNLSVSAIRSNRAVITWKTDIKSSSTVWYSKTSPVDTSVAPNFSRKNKIFAHRVQLNRLEPNTKYYVVVKSTNRLGTTTSSEISFTTLATVSDNTPIITSISGPRSIKAGETETITVNAYDTKNEALNYSVNWGDTGTTPLAQGFTQPIFVQSTTFSHVYNSPGIYNATFTVQNSDGKKNSSTITITVNPVSADTTAPVISNVETKTGSSTATISWDTNEPSTSQIYYSKITPVEVTSNETISLVDNTLSTKHSLSITGLAKSTLYHFVIKSTDASNNTTVSGESAFMTNSGI
jgi:hypothetical protein